MIEGEVGQLLRDTTGRVYLVSSLHPRIAHLIVLPGLASGLEDHVIEQRRPTIKVLICAINEEGLHVPTLIGSHYRTALPQALPVRAKEPRSEILSPTQEGPEAGVLNHSASPRPSGWEEVGIALQDICVAHPIELVHLPFHLLQFCAVFLNDLHSCLLLIVEKLNSLVLGNTLLVGRCPDTSFPSDSLVPGPPTDRRDTKAVEDPEQLVKADGSRRGKSEDLVNRPQPVQGEGPLTSVRNPGVVGSSNVGSPA